MHQAAVSADGRSQGQRPGPAILSQPSAWTGESREPIVNFERIAHGDGYVNALALAPELRELPYRGRAKTARHNGVHRLGRDRHEAPVPQMLHRAGDHLCWVIPRPVENFGHA